MWFGVRARVSVVAEDMVVVSVVVRDSIDLSVVFENKVRV